MVKKATEPKLMRVQLADDTHGLYAGKAGDVLRNVPAADAQAMAKAGMATLIGGEQPDEEPKSE